MHALGLIIGCNQTEEELFNELCNWQDCAFDGACTISKENENTDFLEPGIMPFGYATDYIRSKHFKPLHDLIDFIKDNVSQMIYGYNKYECETIQYYDEGKRKWMESEDFKNFIRYFLQQYLYENEDDICLLFYDYHI